MDGRGVSLVTAQAERLLSEFFKRSNVGLAVFDESLCYQMVNPYLASSIHNTPVEGHVGKHIREILGNVAVQIEPAIKKAFSTAEPVLNFEVAGTLPSRSDAAHWIDNFFPITDSNGEVKQVGAVVVELAKNVELQAMSYHSHPEIVLRSWKDIAHYVGTCVKTVQRWERAYEFPVRRVDPNKGSVVFAFQNEVNDWLHGRDAHLQASLRLPTHERRKRD